jgi:hypothetical protein
MAGAILSLSIFQYLDIVFQLLYCLFVVFKILQTPLLYMIENYCILRVIAIPNDLGQNNYSKFTYSF